MTDGGAAGHSVWLSVVQVVGMAEELNRAALRSDSLEKQLSSQASRAREEVEAVERQLAQERMRGAQQRLAVKEEVGQACSRKGEKA